MEVGPVAVVVVFAVEDGEEGFGVDFREWDDPLLSIEEGFVADVEPLVGPGRDELAATFSKGSITASAYSASA
jgi:hypothetical protein